MAVFAKVGEGMQQVGGECPPGWIQMENPRPEDGKYIALVDGTWGVAPSVVPEKITMRQARLALLSAGLLQHVEDAINALPGDAGKAARIEWDYSSEVHRYKPFVIQLGGAIGLSSEQLDAMFIAAVGIQ